MRKLKMRNWLLILPMALTGISHHSAMATVSEIDSEIRLLEKQISNEKRSEKKVFKKQ